MRLIRLLKNDMAKETCEWVEAQIITPAQARRICARYGTDYDRVRQGTAGYNVLIGLGYLFVGLAVITLLGANWEEIPRAVRMGGLILITVVTQGLGVKYYMEGRQERAAGIFLLGNLFYGASIILIAQIYHLGEHMPDGVFWWALGSLPLGLLIKSPWVTLQALMLGMIWFFMQVDLGFYPALFPIFILGGIYTLIAGKQSMVIFLTVVAAVGIWVEWSLSAFWREGRFFDFYAEHLFVSVALFILLYTFSHWLNTIRSSKAKDYGALLSLWSLRFGLVLMVVMGFEEPWHDLLDAAFDHTLSMAVFAGILAAAALVTAHRIGKTVPVTSLLAVYGLTTGAVLISKDPAHAHYFQIVYNCALIAVGIRLIMAGINQGISHYFFLGIAAILITALMRYIDLIGDYIGGAALFLFFAVLLLGAARFWKKRRHVEERV